MYQHQTFRGTVEGLPDICRWQFDVQRAIVKSLEWSDKRVI